MIILLQGMGNSERAWAQLVSRFDKTTLIQQVPVEHIEVWDRGVKLSDGPTVNRSHLRTLDDALFGLLSIRRAVRNCRAIDGRINVIIAAGPMLGLAALWLRFTGKTKHVIAFLTDYLPIRGPLHVRLHRCIVQAMLRFVIWAADETWTVSPRIPLDWDYVVPLPIQPLLLPPMPPRPETVESWLLDVCQRL